MFRSLADQLEGDHNRHGQIRRNTVHFMRSNREDFEPFHDGEGTFSEYCKYQVFFFSTFLFFLLVYALTLSTLGKGGIYSSTYFYRVHLQLRLLTFSFIFL